MRKILDSFIPSKRDLMEAEKDLASCLGKFLKFKNLSLYFPGKSENRLLTFLPAETLLLLPVRWRGETAAMLRLEGVEENIAFLPSLENLAEMILEKIFAEKLAMKDGDSGLSSEAELFKFMEEELEAVKSGAGRMAFPADMYRLCLGMVVIRWGEDQIIASRHDHEFMAYIYDSLAKKLFQALPEKRLAAPLGKYEGRHDFGVLFNAAGRDACFRLAVKLMDFMEKETHMDALSGRKYRPRLYAGCALYPQDMSGEELGMPAFEQIIRFKNRAMLAADLARNQEGVFLEDRILSFAGIAGRAGRILEGGRKDKIRINLGRLANVGEGMRFFVWGKNRISGEEFLKGQITVVKAEAKESLAEVFYLNKAESLPAYGDRLSLPAKENLDGLDDFSGAQSLGRIMSNAEFLDSLPEKINVLDAFVLLIIRLPENIDENPGLVKQIHSRYLALRLERGLDSSGVAAGKYGKDRIILLVPGALAEEEESVLTALFNEREGRFACGIARFPYLDFKKMDMETNALKALEYAELLPKPYIGVFNSMAMTISADKKYSMGDTFGAIEEYKRAILADAGNAIALNSLGVCMAALGKSGEAQSIWLESLEIAPDGELKAGVCYNLGTLRQKAGANAEAFNWYRKALKNSGRHVFAWLRIGQLNELKGRKKSAKRYYLCAANLADVESDEFVIARRRLARLSIDINERSDARDTLHQLLLKNPYDIASMNILAELYLKENGDPAISEMLAKKSLQIMDNKDAWLILARSLEQAGKREEARRAMERAGKRAGGD